MPETKDTIDLADSFKSARISLDNGWSGRVCLALRDGDAISAQDWQVALCGPEKLFKEPKKSLKVDGGTTVAVYDLKIGDKTLKIAVKTHIHQSGIVNFLRELLRDKSLRNFKTAAILCENGIPAAYPLAAIKQKCGLITKKTVFISEYIEKSINLYTFAANNIPQSNPGDKSSRHIKNQLASQIANILAGLHRAHLWHRDAKTGNFLVVETPAGGIKVMLVDMDGIKPYLLATDKRRLFAFTKLGAVLIWHKGINLTDYLRSVRIYCSLSKVNKHKDRKIFRRLCRSAIALRLLSFAGSAMKK
ncbi:MAG: lipopolysaccharide kinase InaA family protein [Phycisphaerae bacterium]|nr:lipopolysaccharide kinase InaA family protein [Phycisphaerae bacterium]